MVAVTVIVTHAVEISVTAGITALDPHDVSPTIHSLPLQQISHVFLGVGEDGESLDVGVRGQLM